MLFLKGMNCIFHSVTFSSLSCSLSLWVNFHFGGCAVAASVDCVSLYLFVEANLNEQKKHTADTHTDIYRFEVCMIDQPRRAVVSSHLSF